MFMGICKGKGETRRERFTLRNGNLLLKKLESECNYRSDLFTIFSEKELKKATNKYSQLVCHREFFDLYQGFLKTRGCQILVKLFHRDEHCLEWAINEVVVASQVNKHKNILKFLGCCIETEIPSLVFEFPQHGTLYDCIVLSPSLKTDTDHPLLTWKSKLRMAKEIAESVTYLHMGLSRPIIHRDLKLRNIFLTGDYVAKLSDFTVSVSVPLGKDDVEAEWAGALQYMAPESSMSDRYSEKTDVFAFGGVLFEIILGEQISHILLKVEEVLNLIVSDDEYLSEDGSALSRENRVSGASSSSVNKDISEVNSALSGMSTSDVINRDQQALEEATKTCLRTMIMSEVNEEQLMACGELALRRSIKIVSVSYSTFILSSSPKNKLPFSEAKVLGDATSASTLRGRKGQRDRFKENVKDVIVGVRIAGPVATSGHQR
ncbi:Serine-threonine/tyrosine-protein kinase, catalytic domain [Dillenia turbinata]|uniref:Serine-threonine/tyrosine-protein kinase, catalytic domain n=1 Tax=Dillenia turbinata TaxID=194707 RepID=A0AAN8W727_9MAGN